VRGELRVEIVSGSPDLLDRHQSFILSSPREPESGEEFGVERVRLHAGILLLKLHGCESRNAAEQMRGMLVQIPTETAVPLEGDEYYEFQIIGLTVETDNGLTLGKIVQVLETGANDVYVVRGPSGEVLLPAVDDVVREVDTAARRMVVHLIPGLLDERQL
jgi:16S rRNA processing protein RimM